MPNKNKKKEKMRTQTQMCKYKEFKDYVMNSNQLFRTLVQFKTIVVVFFLLFYRHC